MIPRIGLRQALGDSALLGGVLDGESWKPWRALLIAAMGEDLTQDAHSGYSRCGASGRCSRSGRVC
jgi:hypothetical protein